MIAQEEPLVIPPSVFVGESFPWKGKFWKVRLYDPAGASIEFKGETLPGTRALTQNPVMVLEMSGDTTGEEKRRRGAHKHGRLVIRKGFRTRKII